MACIISRSVGPGRLPSSVRALSALARIDYADLFVLSVKVDAEARSAAGAENATPERWARAMFGGSEPTALERFLWGFLLGFRLVRGGGSGGGGCARGPPSAADANADTPVVAGWRVDGRGADWVRLQARSWFLTGNLLVMVRTAADEGEKMVVALATFLQYERWWGRVWWQVLAPVHRALVPFVLRGAVARMGWGM